MRRFAVVGALFLSGCAGSVYEPSALVLPPHIKSIAVRRFVNKTQFYGLEEKLWLDVTNQFIQDGRIAYATNESQADGVAAGEISRYILQPTAYDANLVPRQYKLTVLVDLKFIDRVTNTLLWEEPRLEEDLQFSADTLPGGLSEEEAREQIWNAFAKDILKRTLEGFGSVMGASPRKIEGNEPSEAPSSPQKPSALPQPRPR
jgi:hypothetical protein